MGIQGILVDKVTKIGSHCKNISTEYFFEAVNEWRKIFDSISDKKYVVDGINTIEASWRTISADQYYGQNSHPTSLAHNLRRIRANLSGVANFPLEDPQHEERLKIELSASSGSLGFQPALLPMSRYFFITKKATLGVALTELVREMLW